MRFIAVLRSSEDTGFPPPALAEGIGRLSVEARKAGALVEAGGLLPVATATRVGVADGQLTITDGPSGEPSPPVGSYAIYDVASRDEAIEWTRRFMDLHRQTWPGWEGESEIRQVFGPQDMPSA